MNEKKMTIKSMTGFARATVQWQGAEWQCEIKSVNGRNLDLRLRLPDGCDFLEPLIREQIPKSIRRGAVMVTVSIAGGEAKNISINADFLARVADMRKTADGRFDPAPMRFEQVLAIPGMVEFQSAAPKIDPNDAPEIFRQLIAPAIHQLDQSRAKEGGNLHGILSAHIDAIARNTDQAGARIAPQAEAMKSRIRDQLTAVMAHNAAIDEQRMTQELAMQAIKVDVREEIDRLRSHIQSARDLLSGGDAVGRRLDFLAQEFNREANTLCAKSADITLGKIGLELKNIIDQFREQVQNIE